MKNIVSLKEGLPSSRVPEGIEACDPPIPAGNHFDSGFAVVIMASILKEHANLLIEPFPFRRRISRTIPVVPGNTIIGIGSRVPGF